MSNNHKKKQYEIQKQKLREKQKHKQKEKHKNKYKVEKKKEWLDIHNDSNSPVQHQKDDSYPVPPPNQKPSTEFIEDLESKWDYTEEEDLYFSFSKKQIHLIKKRYYSSRKVR
jgi:hypothetical protein